MKKIFSAVFFTALLLLTGCDKENSGNDPDNVDINLEGKITWKDLVKKHPFLAEFPAYQGEIDNYQHRDYPDLEYIVLADFQCNKTVVNTYYDKMNSTDFTKTEEEINLWSKTISGKKYTFSGTYEGGTFGCTFSCETKN